MELVLAALLLLVLMGATYIGRARLRANRGPETAAPTRGRFQRSGRIVDQYQPLVLEHESGRQLFAEIVDRTESVLWERQDGLHTHQASLIAFDKVLSTLPVLALALKGGKVARILNPEALDAGTQLKSSNGGFLGSVYGEKHIAANLRFSAPQDVVKLATPIAVFKVASAVTGQYYLDRINTQMMTIESQVRQVRIEHRNETYGEITAAAEACAELEEGFAQSLNLTADERTRLVGAEAAIDKAYNQKQKDVEDFTRDIEALFSADSIRRDDAERLLKEAAGARLYDLQLLIYAATIRNKLNLLRAQIDLGAEHGRGELAELKLNREREAMTSDLEKARAALATLAVTREEAKARWKMKGLRNPPKLLDRFQPTGHAMREQLAAAPQMLLPALTPVPMVLEARLDERGSLQVVSAAPETV